MLNWSRAFAAGEGCGTAHGGLSESGGAGIADARRLAHSGAAPEVDGAHGREQHALRERAYTAGRE
jgi:hypothetical protein